MRVEIHLTGLPDAFAAIIMPQAASLSRTQEIASKADEIFKNIPGVKTRSVVTGYSLLDSGFKTNASTIFVTFDDFDARAQAHHALDERLVADIGRRDDEIRSERDDRLGIRVHEAADLRQAARRLGVVAEIRDADDLRVFARQPKTLRRPARTCHYVVKFFQQPGIDERAHRLGDGGKRHTHMLRELTTGGRAVLANSAQHQRFIDAT